MPDPLAIRGNTPPFVPADATKLGFPVMAKPINAPKLNLSAFPKVRLPLPVLPKSLMSLTMFLGAVRLLNSFSRIMGETLDRFLVKNE